MRRMQETSQKCFNMIEQRHVLEAGPRAKGPSPLLTRCIKVCVTGMLMDYRLQTSGTDGIWLQDRLTGRAAL